MSENVNVRRINLHFGCQKCERGAGDSKGRLSFPREQSPCLISVSSPLGVAQGLHPNQINLAWPHPTLRYGLLPTKTIPPTFLEWPVPTLSLIVSS